MLENALAKQNQPLHWILVIVAVLNTLISLFFYLRIVKQMMLRDDERATVSAPVGGLALVNVCGIVVLLLGFLIIQPVKDCTDRYAANLFVPSVSQPRVDESEPIDAVSSLDMAKPLRGDRMEP